MRFTRFVQCCVSIGLLFTPALVYGQTLTIDLLDDRGAMLADVRAQVSLIKRDLSKLMLALRSREPEEKK
jgi:hypothetical protein